VLYAVCLLATAFGHHHQRFDLKTPFRCTACAASAVGSDPPRSEIVGSWILRDLGRAAEVEFTACGVLLPVRTPERSPPASA
jgi:hypothetical protein